jgi:hypothetical protein
LATPTDPALAAAPDGFASPPGCSARAASSQHASAGCLSSTLQRKLSTSRVEILPNHEQVLSHSLCIDTPSRHGEAQIEHASQVQQPSRPIVPTRSKPNVPRRPLAHRRCSHRSPMMPHNSHMRAGGWQVSPLRTIRRKRQFLRHCPSPLRQPRDPLGRDPRQVPHPRIHRPRTQHPVLAPTLHEAAALHALVIGEGHGDGRVQNVLRLSRSSRHAE